MKLISKLEKKIMRLGMLLAVFTLAFVVSDSAFADVKPGDAAPDFTLANQDGKNVSLSNFKGKTVVLHWTNANCPFIKRHYKENTFSSLNEKYSEKSVVFLAIDSSKSVTSAAIKATHTENGLKYDLLQDNSGKTGKAYGAKTTPHVFIVDSAGKIAYNGAVDNDSHGDVDSKDKVNFVSQSLDELLAGKPVSKPDTQPYGCSVKYLE